MSDTLTSSDAAISAAKKTPGEFTIWLMDAQHELGITEKELRLRKNQFLTKDHWQKIGTKIFLTSGALNILKKSLCIPLPDSAQNPSVGTPQKKRGAASIKKTPTPPEDAASRQPPLPPEITLKVWRGAPEIRNRYLIEAYKPGTDPLDRRNIVRVRVTSNEHFLKDMDLPARLVQEPDFYECTRRAPRRRGRWN